MHSSLIPKWPLGAYYSWYRQFGQRGNLSGQYWMVRRFACSSTLLRIKIAQSLSNFNLGKEGECFIKILIEKMPASMGEGAVFQILS